MAIRPPASIAQVFDRTILRPVDWPRCRCCGDWASTETNFVCDRLACRRGQHGFADWLVDNPEPALADPDYDSKMQNWLFRYRNRHFERDRR